MEDYKNLELGIERLRQPLSLEQVNSSILTPYRQILSSMRQVYIFGCKQLGKKVYEGCVTAGLDVLGFIDNNSSLHDKQCCGKKVYALKELPPKTPAVIIIASTTHEYELHNQLILAGFVNVIAYPVLSVFDAVHFPPEAVHKNMQVDLIKNTEHYLQLYQTLADQKSKRTINGIIKYRMTLNPVFLKEICQTEQPEYFDTDVVRINHEEVFVDGGGYDGDTVLNFLQATNNQYKKIYFFEPDGKLILKAKQTLAEFTDIIFFEAAIYSHAKTLRFKTTGGLDGMFDEEGDREVKAMMLDECINEKITFLKLDVEGAETDALIGAKKHLEQDVPTLAISGYHNPADIWQLPELIKSLNSSYQIYLRHYSNTSYETIVYAI